MNLTPQQWLNHVLDAVYTRNLDQLPGLEIAIKQPLADRHDWDRLELFFTDVLGLGVRPEIMRRVRIDTLNRFESGIRSAFETAAIHADNDESIEAFYFEYFFDGTDSCTGDVFLCTQYRSAAEDQYGGWAAEFKGIITGPLVREYMDYDIGDSSNKAAKILIDAYIDARFLAALGRVLDGLDCVVLPTGFARHDHPLIRILPL